MVLDGKMRVSRTEAAELADDVLAVGGGEQGSELEAKEKVRSKGRELCISRWSRRGVPNGKRAWGMLATNLKAKKVRDRQMTTECVQLSHLGVATRKLDIYWPCNSRTSALLQQAAVAVIEADM